MSQGPPLDPALIFGDVWANGPALAAMSGVIGPCPRAVWAGGNTLLGTADVARQNVHADIIFNHATFPFACASNFYLSDVSEGCGSTGVWLGSHRDTTFNDHLDEEKMAKAGTLPSKFGIRYDLLGERRKWAPPINPTIKKGSVVVRDLRLWHAGVPSKSKEYRMMLGFVYTAWWYKCTTPVVFPDSAREIVFQWSKQKHPVIYNTYFAAPFSGTLEGAHL
jgi:ectoine hydroxylase-related dioxygenase (phytanoyl-CoA dioxygenase family)